MPLSQNIKYLLPMSLIATQLSNQAGRTIEESEIGASLYDGLAIPQPTVRVTLKPRKVGFTMVTEYFVFTRSQVVTFYNNVSGSSIVATTILEIKIADDRIFAELIPAQL